MYRPAYEASTVDTLPGMGVWGLSPGLESTPNSRVPSRRPSVTDSEGSDLSDSTDVSESCDANESSQGTTTIFDWDDTLLPTWFIQEVVKPCTPDADFRKPLSSDSPFFEALAEVARAVREVLVAARQLGRVAIVTLSKRGWVEQSANSFLPGLCIAELLEELDIPVYYAFEHLSRPSLRQAVLEDGVSPRRVTKRKAMSRCLRRLLRGSTSRLNVISIGDSTAEQEAIKEVLWCWAHTATQMPLCKTVRLAEEPPAKQLADQLALLSQWLGHMALYPEDFDLSFDGADARQDAGALGQGPPRLPSP